MSNDSMKEIDRLHSQFARLRVLVRGISNTLDYEGNSLFSCVCRYGTPRQRRIMDDIYNAVFWLRKEVLDFPIIPQDVEETNNDTD